MHLAHTLAILALQHTRTTHHAIPHTHAHTHIHTRNKNTRTTHATSGPYAYAYTPTYTTHLRRLAHPPTLVALPDDVPSSTAAAAPPPASDDADVADNNYNYPLDPHRWTQLALLALLALLSDWVCFATAAVPGEWAQIEGHEASQLIDIFLFSNVVSCFLYTDIAATFGLRRVIVAAASLMTFGCLLRSGVPNPFVGAEALARSMPSYPTEVVGTILVGAAQPFFQCSPPLLSATWFGPSERALATATAINFNQVGIATAFLVGGFMATSPSGMHAYFDVLSVSCVAVAAATALLFRERPDEPPSASTAADWAAEERKGKPPGFSLTSLSYPGKAAALVQQPGFLFALAAFVASIGTTNVVSAFTAPELARAGFPEGYGIDLAGAGFQVAIVVGGIVLGSLVDRTKRFRPAILACLGVAIVALGALGSAEGFDQSFSLPVVVGLLLSLGFSAGPVQPIAAELAVEVAYPCDENAVEATQQLAGNLFSALLVPICERASVYDLTFGTIPESDMRGDTLVLLALVISTTAYFYNFNAPLVRTLLDGEGLTVGVDDEQALAEASVAAAATTTAAGGGGAESE